MQQLVMCYDNKMVKSPGCLSFESTSCGKPTTKKKHFELGNYKNECVDLDTEENLSCKTMGTGQKPLVRYPWGDKHECNGQLVIFQSSKRTYYNS